MKQSGVLAILLTCLAGLGMTSSAFAAFPGRDGRIAFTKASRAPTTGFTTFSIHSVHPNGDSRLKVAEEGSAPAYSPTGRQLAYVVRGVTYIAKADGTKARPIAQGTNPAWSPGSDYLVLEQGRSGEDDSSSGYPNLAIVEVRTGESRPLVTYAGEPAWAPDGRYIAFVDFGGVFNGIVRIRPDGTGRRVIYTPPVGWAASSPDWSPTGARIAFTRAVEDGSSLVVVKPDGRDPRVIASREPDAGAITSLAWAPSGTRIAFAASEGIYQSLYTVGATGGRARLVRSRAFEPTWRPLP